MLYLLYHRGTCCRLTFSLLPTRPTLFLCKAVLNTYVSQAFPQQEGSPRCVWHAAARHLLPISPKALQ